MKAWLAGFELGIPLSELGLCAVNCTTPLPLCLPCTVWRDCDDVRASVCRTGGDIKQEPRVSPRRACAQQTQAASLQKRESCIMLGHDVQLLHAKPPVRDVSPHNLRCRRSRAQAPLAIGFAVFCGHAVMLPIDGAWPQLGWPAGLTVQSRTACSFACRLAGASWPHAAAGWQANPLPRRSMHD